MGVYWIHPDVCPSVCRQLGFRNFLENYWPNSLHSWHLPLLGESLDLYSFSSSKPNFRPSGGQIFGRKWGFRNFLKKQLAQFISYLAFTLIGWVSWPLYIFVFLASFSWRIPTCVAHDCKIEIFIGYFWMRWVVIRAGVYCPHLWAQLVDFLFKHFIDI